MPKGRSKSRSRRRQPTLHIGNVGEHSFSPAKLARWHGRRPTPRDVLGPFYRKGAPFRSDLSPPAAKGTALVITGSVYGAGERKPLATAVLDLWQANADGHYDNDDPAHPPPPDVYIDRARLRTDQSGRYEFKTVYPGPYMMDTTTWRTPHLHYKVRAPGYRTLVTQVFFRDAPYLATDPFVEKALIIALKAKQGDRGPYYTGTFNIVLARHRRAKLQNKKR
jgi:catechol 1,2-dioxygenase